MVGLPTMCQTHASHMLRNDEWALYHAGVTSQAWSIQVLELMDYRFSAPSLSLGKDQRTCSHPGNFKGT